MATSRSEPVRHTCPDIDRAIDDLLAIGNEMDKADTFENCNLQYWSGVIDDIARGSRCTLERLRDANSSLREWGNELASELDDKDDQIKTLERENEELKEQMTSLQDEISEMSYEIKELQS